MISIFIFVILLALGIVLGCSRKCSYDLNAIGAGIILVSSVVLFIFALMIIVSHTTASNFIQQNKIEYDGLCKRYEIIKSEYEDVSKSQVIADITAWNKDVYNTKYWTENPWTNWFNPKSIADNLEYIPLE